MFAKVKMLFGLTGYVIVGGFVAIATVGALLNCDWIVIALTSVIWLDLVPRLPNPLAWIKRPDSADVLAIAQMPYVIERPPPRWWISTMARLLGALVLLVVIDRTIRLADELPPSVALTIRIGLYCITAAMIIARTAADVVVRIIISRRFHGS